MATISKNNTLLASIDLFATTSENQQEIISKLCDRVQKLPEMVKLTSIEVERAMNSSPGLVSATFHRSLDGTRIFNYGQWESKEAFKAILNQPGFNPEKPYWQNLARNEFHLYHVAHTQTKTV